MQQQQELGLTARHRYPKLQAPSLGRCEDMPAPQPHLPAQLALCRHQQRCALISEPARLQ